jgi:hypothetical protein
MKWDLLLINMASAAAAALLTPLILLVLRRRKEERDVDASLKRREAGSDGGPEDSNPFTIAQRAYDRIARQREIRSD